MFFCIEVGYSTHNNTQFTRSWTKNFLQKLINSNTSVVRPETRKSGQRNVKRRLKFIENQFAMFYHHKKWTSVYFISSLMKMSWYTSNVTFKFCDFKFFWDGGCGIDEIEWNAFCKLQSEKSKSKIAKKNSEVFFWKFLLINQWEHQCRRCSKLRNT